MKLIGLTGGVATGKSTVARMFKRAGLPVLDADRFAHAVIKRKKPAYVKIVRFLGKEILNTRKEIDKGRLAAIIFKDKILRKKVEKIVHPEVWRAIKRKIIAKKKKFIVVEVPLLFEAGWKKKFDIVVVVICSRKIQRQRCNPKFYNRIAAQMGISKKAQLADFIIDNSYSKKKTFAQVKSLLQIIDKGKTAC
jgi:dephospho-CoA kinase